MIFYKIWPTSIIIEETEIEDWKQFSYEYGINNGLNQLEAENFSDMISYFIADGPAVPLEDRHYKIQKIQFDILDAVKDIKELEDEEDQVDFNSVPGKSQADKLETLLINYYKN